ncbi:MAG TPA: hypothetical protein VFT79_12840 [Solirubrobacterales bacterium]|nr:hypothetical protein [Solirubrobacterales bacterium]
MDSKLVGLRAQDVYSGLQTVDQTSGLIAAELDTTRLTGMAATVAANIKGIDLIKDPKVLKVIAAQQWGIDSFALPQVLQVLQEVDYVTLHEDRHKNVTRIEEHIPLLHDNLYERLGSHWQSNQPSELDRAAVDSLELLAEAPRRLSDLAAHIGDQTTVERMLQIGDEAQFAKRLELSDGEPLIWSPYCAYEQPEALVRLFESFDEEEVRTEFARVREYQGLPIDGSASVLSDAVGQGILLANAIKGSGGDAAFAFVPYRAGAARLRMEKVVLEKALVLLACVRYGENFARHRIRMPAAILRKLRDGAALSSTTEASSQYRTAAQSQIVRLEPTGGGFFRAKLIDTPDNLAAVDLALDLLTHGEPVVSREDPQQKLLFTDGSYLTPLMTMKTRKPKARISGDVVLSLVDTVRGERGG